jgi:hypothetical protein
MRLVAFALCGLFLVGGCSATRGFCEASADCDGAFVLLDASGDSDDDVAVCTAEQDTILRALRANEEDECQEAADALDAWHACVASEFAGGEDGCDAITDECESELDDLQDAASEIDGNECSASED